MSSDTRFGEVWHCRLCGAERIEGRDAYLAHCREHHAEVVSPKGTILATRELLAHLDGEACVTALYDYRLPDGRALAQVCDTEERAGTFSGFKMGRR
jgi:hypothetical protein